jgi:hypothetical protein
MEKYIHVEREWEGRVTKQEVLGRTNCLLSF